MEPMLARMSGSMFGLQLGQAVGALARETVSGTEVGLPLVADRTWPCCRPTSRRSPRAWRSTSSQVRLYLAVREAARVRLFAEVPWLGPAAAGRGARLRPRHHHRHRRASSRRSATSTRPTPRPCRRRCRTSCSAPTRPPPSRPPWPGSRPPSPWSRAGSTSSPSGPPASTCRRRTRSARPCGAAARRAGRPRRRSAGWSASSCGPRRLRDAANLWAALEARPARPARDAAWGHPDIAPTAADLDDPLGLRRAAAARPSSDDVDAALDQLLRARATSTAAADRRGRR